MPEECIGLIPAQGYAHSDQAQSKMALRYLAWVEKNRGVHIQTAANHHAEVELVGCGSVDGFIPETNEVYEIGEYTCFVSKKVCLMCNSLQRDAFIMHIWISRV